MSNYQGPATLIAGDSAIEVVATLSGSRSGDVRQWGGSAQTGEVAEGFLAAMESGDVTIRLPDGQEGVVVATTTAIGSGRLRISGNGVIPF
ncbi:DUF4873 domain-containing protein [Streptomyces sp. SID3212]|uniref:DUF4873 domain-containing protein n=1 Tax=unclassified Streptomyces TaxID=2593676 RepID=UPI001370604B|nr:DUF4873 domain-containing protein [Streptomyces sp. SID3212]MYV53075.1 DUF4873 domain-containing protein [Streptomyces sp. SID3212]